jgi:hypothetical protein
MTTISHDKALTHHRLNGQRFGLLLVLGRSGKKSNSVLLLCKCDCGNEKEIRAEGLSLGRVVSCGCYHKKNHTTHNSYRTPEYLTWTSMWQRCTNTKSRAFKWYGARGISICERWSDFEAFLEDMGAKPGPEYSIDRIDNDGNYEPGNCRWTTNDVQALNKRQANQYRVASYSGEPR